MLSVLASLKMAVGEVKVHHRPRSPGGVERSSAIWPCAELCVAGRAPADRVHARFASSIHERWAKGIFVVGHRIEGDEFHAGTMHGMARRAVAETR